jgi:hypothetical protein
MSEHIPSNESFFHVIQSDWCRKIFGFHSFHTPLAFNKLNDKVPYKVGFLSIDLSDNSSVMRTRTKIVPYTRIPNCNTLFVVKRFRIPWIVNNVFGTRATKKIDDYEKKLFAVWTNERWFHKRNGNKQQIYELYFWQPINLSYVPVNGGSFSGKFF